jgi:iron complex transport system substrate-binding protein
LQAREVGKAVRIGCGLATVIGSTAVSQATLSRRRGAPLQLAWGFFVIGFAGAQNHFASQGSFVYQLAFAAGRVLKILRRAAYAVAAALFCCALLQAQAQITAAPIPPVASQVATTPASREVTDETGRTIRVPQSVHRIVSLAPSLTETIYALGLQDLLVGDTDYCDFPPAAQKITKVGGVINPSLEAIAVLHPDLVLVTKTLNRVETVQALAELGIPSYATDPHTVDDIFSSTQRLADLLGAPEAGVSITKDLERRLADTQQRVASLPQRRVLFVVWTDPLISVGRSTFIADALLRAGAISIVDSPQNWPQISLEEVVRQQPDFLIFAESHSDAAPPEVAALSTLPGWRTLDAVRNRRYVLVSDAVNRPAMRIVDAIQDIAKQLHPEAFAEKPGNGGAEPAAPPSLSLLSVSPFPFATQYPFVTEGASCAL